MPSFRPWFDDSPRRSDVVTIPVFWIALVLSLLVHVAAFWFLYFHKPKIMIGDLQDDREVPISVRLAKSEPRPPSPQETPASPIPPAVATPPPAAPRAPAPKARVPQVLSTLPNVPSTERVPMQPLPRVPAPPAPTQPPEPLPGDLSAYIASQRRARGEAPEQLSADPAKDRDARRDRAIAENLASANVPERLGEARNTGGVFQITYKGYDYAEFTFFGYLNNIKRRATQKIEVRRGSNATIDIAIIRAMIAIIRQYEKEDFEWKSDREGRIVRLSARLEDNAQLEDFLMHDFFDPMPRRNTRIGP